MSDNQPLAFDSISRISVPVKLEDRDYILYEVNGPALDIYNDALMSSSQYDTQTDKASFSMKGLVGIEAPMLTHCLFKVGNNGKENPVPKQVIQSWPGRVRKVLHEKLLEISGLSSNSEDDSKNSSSDTTDGS